MKVINNLILTILFTSFTLSLPLHPFRNSIEVVVTPQDFQDVAEYILWKVPEVKENIKTTIKQKLLNKLLTQRIQDTVVPNFDMYSEYINNPNNLYHHNVLKVDNKPQFPTQAVPKTPPPGSYLHHVPTVPPPPPGAIPPPFSEPPVVSDDEQPSMVSSVEIEIMKPKGLVNSILSGPSITQERMIQIKANSNDSDDSSDEELEIGYSNPSRIKNRKSDLGVKYYVSDEDSEDDMDPFYDE
ncbi:hypothetical protein JA1_004401 [Spathaspora sp. JA1]|nr:hypothetical protein JA1_004401 [Spathaspora sp. JA1]